jgi:phage-related protein (TIGR01555 family)
MKTWFRNKLRAFLGVQDAKPVEDAKPMRITSATLARTLKPEPVVEFKRYEPPKGVIPDGVRDSALAMDATPYQYVNDAYVSNYWIGYPALSMLSQMPEYRKISTEIAKAMTRRFIKLSAKGDGDKTDKIAKLVDAMTRFGIQDLFKQAAEHDGFFGRGQLFIDVESPKGGLARDDEAELQSPLLMRSAKIKKDSLKGFRLVEPVWTYPSAYNATDPLAPDYYKPSKWYVMGKTVHASRMLMFVSRPMPDLLKAAYNFGGLSMSQMAQPYVQNWIRTRDSVSDLVHSFSVSGLKTNMGAALQGGDDAGFAERAKLFNQMRDNRGLMVIDKDSEEFFQMATPLGTLDSLQQQSQEQMSSVSNTPLIVLLGVTPSGLNASSEGELQVWNEYVLGQQKSIFEPNLKVVLDVLQLNEFGEIDPDIVFEFEPLEEQNVAELATVQKTKADTDAVLIQSGVIAPEEVRERLVADKDSGYNSLDASAVPEQGGEDDDAEDIPSGGGKADDAITRAFLDTHYLAADMTWRESDHDRATNGQFGSGGGGSVKTPSEAKAQKTREDRRTYGYVDLKGNVRSGGLDKSQHIIEGAFHNYIERHKDELVQRYFDDNKNVIDPDLVKKLNGDFANNPDLAAAVHEPSSKLAKIIFTHALEEKAKAGDASPTLFTAGGSGSGKSTTMPIAQKVTGARPDGLIYDSVLGSLGSASKKIDEALNVTKGDVVIAYTNANIEQAFAQNIKRERSVSISVLVGAHAGASKTIKQISDEYRNNPRVKVVVTNNLGLPDEAAVGSLDDVPKYDAAAETEKLTAIAKELLDSGKLGKDGKPLVDAKKFALLTAKNQH